MQKILLNIFKYISLLFEFYRKEQRALFNKIKIVKTFKLKFRFMEYVKFTLEDRYLLKYRQSLDIYQKQDIFSQNDY